MSIKELFKGQNESMNIDGIDSKDGLINIIFDKNGIGNFDIALKEDKNQDASKSKPLSLKIKAYKIENFKFFGLPPLSDFFNQVSKVSDCWHY